MSKRVQIRRFVRHHFSERSGAGFTLIELLVVIAIIGILSSVVLASLNTARSKGRDARRISDIKQLQLALELFYDSNGTYPTAIGTTASSVLVTGGYISTIPTDPSALTAYSYAGLGGTTCTSYHLGANLEVTNNSVLSDDVDAVAGTNCSGTTQTPAASAADFAGGGVITCGGSAGTDGCYDVKP
ncbi:MAG: prepilin-type N-terminal cleavage/methylation domain-containing protein [bacterium]|nr:prepilin-type N-terminal cleavage/methylation domain-containing protein [bacterium]